jgi:hypothetical protein
MKYNSSVVNDLINLFDQERAAVIGGDWGKLTDFHKRKSAATTRLQDSSLSPSDLRVILRESQRSASLLKNAIAGIGDAQRRIEAIERGGNGLKLYDATGLSVHLNPEAGQNIGRF